MLSALQTDFRPFRFDVVGAMLEKKLDGANLVEPGQPPGLYSLVGATNGVCVEAVNPYAAAGTRALASAPSRSPMMSSMCSMPIDSRTMSWLTPASASSESFNCECVVVGGWIARDL